MAPQEDELLPENATGYKLSQPKQSLAEYQKMGKFNKRHWIWVTRSLSPLSHVRESCILMSANGLRRVRCG